jgi:DNA-binding NarL/FixJ family response regulator
MVTTEGGEKTVLEAIELGAKGYIRKPFTAAQMQTTLAKVL